VNRRRECLGDSAASSMGDREVFHREPAAPVAIGQRHVAANAIGARPARTARMRCGPAMLLVVGYGLNDVLPIWLSSLGEEGVVSPLPPAIASPIAPELVLLLCPPEIVESSSGA
jgi:hypothetical protein